MRKKKFVLNVKTQEDREKEANTALKKKLN